LNQSQEEKTWLEKLSDKQEQHPILGLSNCKKIREILAREAVVATVLWFTLVEQTHLFTWKLIQSTNIQYGSLGHESIGL